MVTVKSKNTELHYFHHFFSFYIFYCKQGFIIKSVVGKQ